MPNRRNSQASTLQTDLPVINIDTKLRRRNLKGAVLANHVLEHLGLLANPIYGRLVLTHMLMVNSVCNIFKDRPLQKL